MLRVVMAGLVGAGAGCVVGFLLGAHVGGNYLPDVVIGGDRGYEAIGGVGALAGAVLGMLGAIALATRGTKVQRSV
jgi:hypothetical protein